MLKVFPCWIRTLPHCHIRYRSSTVRPVLATTMVIRKMTTPSQPRHRKLINFLRGWPNPALLPSKLVHEAADAVLSNPDIAVPAMLYGPDEGDHRLRQELGKWLTDFYSDHIQGAIDVDRIAITGGASQNLACLLQTFTDPAFTRNIWIVAPSYFLAFRIFNDSGFGSKLRSIPEDAEGLDIEYLRKEIDASERAAEAKGNSKPVYKLPTPWGKVYKHIVYAVPTFSNPSSKTMSLSRRQEVVRLAREYDALIITDDVYDQLQWHVTVPGSQDTATPESKQPESPLVSAAIPRIVDVDRYLDGGAERPGADAFGNAASNGTFSKIVGPGLRTGWCEGTPKLAYGVAQTGSSRSGGSPSQIASTFLAEALARGGVQEHVYKVLQPAYARRWKTMIDAVQKYLVPLGVKLPHEDGDVAGGYFLWLRLPPHIKAKLLTRRCKDTHNLVIADGGLFEVPGDAMLDVWKGQRVHPEDMRRVTSPTAFPYDIRLCFAWEEEEALEEGIQRLAEVMKSMLDEPEGLNPKVMRKSFGESDGENMDVGQFQ